MNFFGFLKQYYLKQIKIKFPNLEFVEMPSKFQIYNKHHTRSRIFEQFLNEVVLYCQNNDNQRRDLLKILYNFIFTYREWFI